MTQSKIVAARDRRSNLPKRNTTAPQRDPRVTQWHASVNWDLSELSIGMSSLSAFLTGARAAGIDVDAMLRTNGVQTNLQRPSAGRITVKQWAHILQDTINSLNDEACGLLSRPYPVGTFLMVCRAFIHCKTIGQAMERFVNFYNLISTGIKYELEADRKSVQFKLIVADARDVKNPVILDFILVAFHRLFSWLTSELIQLDSVCLLNQRPAHFREYEQAFFHTPVQLGQCFHGISFSRAYLDLPIIRTEHDIEEYVARLNSALFLPISTTGKLSFALRAYLLGKIEQNAQMPELHEAAEHFGLHVRTLCRRLREEGLNFQEIKSRVRRDIAIHHLSKSSASMQKIADCAGFSETSAFIRAFRSWTNMTPLAYRKAMSSSDANAG